MAPFRNLNGAPLSASVAHSTIFSELSCWIASASTRTVVNKNSSGKKTRVGRSWVWIPTPGKDFSREKIRQWERIRGKWSIGEMQIPVSNFPTRKCLYQKFMGLNPVPANDFFLMKSPLKWTCTIILLRNLYIIIISCWVNQMPHVCKWQIYQEIELRCK